MGPPHLKTVGDFRRFWAIVRKFEGDPRRSGEGRKTGTVLIVNLRDRAERFLDSGLRRNDGWLADKLKVG
tara:strand:- start:224 stop:433 length:210 start_codon:yes stop_codon:yes gene_type:complete